MSLMDKNEPRPHIAIIPLAGMGHVNPFLRIANMLLSRNCKLTLITAKSFISSAEANHIALFCKANPEVKHLEFEPLPFANIPNVDPFFLEYDAIIRSADAIRPLLSSLSPRLSAIFTYFLVCKSVASIAADLRIPFYVIPVIAARIKAFALHLPVLSQEYDKLSNGTVTEIEIPGLGLVSTLSIPISFLNPNHLLAMHLISNTQYISEAKGILINTFDWFEPEVLHALNSGRVLSNLPPALAIGPLEGFNLVKDQCESLPWLDKQPKESVVFVNFGSRTAISKEQITELKNALEMSGCRFLWVIKTAIVDKDDKEELKTVLGESFLERTQEVGMVVRGWVDQYAVLGHPAIAGFISHCGWNSVMESAYRGVPIVAWPQHGDQMIGAEVVEMSELGVFDRTWCPGLKRLVTAAEIAKMITELTENQTVRLRAKKVGEEARKAIQVGGSSDKNLQALIKSLSTFSDI